MITTTTTTTTTAIIVIIITPVKTGQQVYIFIILFTLRYFYNQWKPVAQQYNKGQLNEWEWHFVSTVLIFTFHICWPVLTEGKSIKVHQYIHPVFLLVKI